MKITNIRMVEEGESVILQADCKIRSVGWDVLYFKYHKKYKDFLYLDASPFAAHLMVPSMKLGEDLIIEGSISQKLYNGMFKIMDWMLPWHIGVKRIKIIADKIIPDPESLKPNKVGMYFSAGVDSFYTYLKHKDDAEDKITHFILVNGNDIDLRNKELWQETRDNILDVAKKGNVEVIEVETNAQSLIEPIISPVYSHIGSLAAVGLGLRNGFKKIYISATFSKEQETREYGSRSDMDNYWSTEALSFMSDGSEASRLNKVLWQVGKSPLALEHLRVCYKNVKGQYNCGHCDKCVRTMISLYIAGTLDQAKYFPHTIDPKLAGWLAHRSGVPHFMHQENLDELKKRNLYPELQNELEKGLVDVMDGDETLKEKVVRKIIYLDHMYLGGKMFKVWLSVVHPY